MLSLTAGSSNAVAAQSRHYRFISFRSFRLQAQSPRHTSDAAARSSSARPVDLNSVISSCACGPLFLPRAEFEEVAEDILQRDDLLLQRNDDVAGLLGRRRGCRHRRGRGDRVVVAFAHRRRETADQVDMGSLQQTRPISGAVAIVAEETMSASRTAASRSSAMAGSMPSAVSAKAVATALRAGAVPDADGRDRPHRRMRLGEKGRQRAGADHQQLRGVLARQIGRRQRRGAGGAPLRSAAGRRSGPPVRRWRRASADSAPSPPACRWRCRARR